MGIISNGGGGGGTGAMTQLGDTTLGAPATSVNISGIAGSATSLLIVLMLIGDAVAVPVDAGIRFNNDSGTNYGWQMVDTSAAALVLAHNDAQTSGLAGTYAGASATSPGVGTGAVLVPNYTGTTFNKTYNLLHAANPGTFANNTSWSKNGSGWWKSNAAITRVTVIPLSGTNWTTGSRMTIYGIT